MRLGTAAGDAVYFGSLALWACAVAASVVLAVQRDRWERRSRNPPPSPAANTATKPGGDK